MVELPAMPENEDISATSSLLDEINTVITNVSQIVENLMQKVKHEELSTAQGLSFLEMKNNLLLSYLRDTIYFIFRKCSGNKIANDPCIHRLIEIRTVLEKIRPMDKKLKFQIDRLVKSAASSNDATKMKANLNNFEDLEEDEDESDDDQNEDPDAKAKSGVYVPPKLSSVHYPGDENAFQRNKRLQDKSKQHALSSAILQDLAEEYLDTPIEVHQGSKAQQILSKQQKERQEYEEEYMTRLPVTKAEKHELRKLTTLGVLGNEVTDYGRAKTKGKKRKQAPKSKGKGSKRKKFSH